MRLYALLAVLFPLFLAAPALAHEIRPAYLDMRRRRQTSFP